MHTTRTYTHSNTHCPCRIMDSSVNSHLYNPLKVHWHTTLQYPSNATNLSIQYRDKVLKPHQRTPSSRDGTHWSVTWAHKRWGGLTHTSTSREQLTYTHSYRQRVIAAIVQLYQSSVQRDNTPPTTVGPLHGSPFSIGITWCQRVM